MTFVNTKNLLKLLNELTSYGVGDMPVYIQIEDKVYPIRTTGCIMNFNGHNNAMIISASLKIGGEIPKDCITCRNNVYGECYHYEPVKDVSDNQCYCELENWKPIN